MGAIFISMVSYTLFGQDLMNYANSLNYANYLFSKKDYQDAALEYKRVALLEPNDTLAMLRLIQSYRLANDFKQAHVCLSNFFPDCPFYPEPFATENIKMLFGTHQYQQCLDDLKLNASIDSIIKIKYELGSLLMLHKWNEAKNFAERQFIINRKNRMLDDMYQTALQGIDLKLKNPRLAAVYSGLIPGSGKAYTGQWKDGFYAFLFTSAFSWLAYASFKDKGITAAGFIYGSVAFSFYVSTIYGSVKSAVSYNEQAKKRLMRRVEVWMDN